MGQHHVKQKPIRSKYINTSHACTLPCCVHRQQRVLIRVTSVPSLICSGLFLGSRSKPGLKAPAWAWFCSGNFLHYINIWYPPPPQPIQSVFIQPRSSRTVLHQRGLSSRCCRNSGQSDKSRSENRWGEKAARRRWNVGGNHELGWELLGSEPSWQKRGKTQLASTLQMFF